MDKPEEFLNISKVAVIEADNNRISFKKLLDKYENLKKESGIEDPSNYILKTTMYENEILEFQIVSCKVRNNNYKKEYKAWLEEELKKLND